eukprot:3599100-Rhodomonas_salina.1
MSYKPGAAGAEESEVTGISEIPVTSDEPLYAVSNTKLPLLRLPGHKKKYSSLYRGLLAQTRSLP